MPKIDVEHLNALRPKPKPSENPPDTVRIPSDDGEYSMEVDRVPMGRTLRKRKEKVEKHLKRGQMIRKRKVSEKDGNQKSTNNPHDESVDSRPDDWENDYCNPTIAAYTRQNMHIEEDDEDYEDERATEYKAILDEEDTLLHHSSLKRNAPSIDITGSLPIDAQPHQRNRKRASTDIANYSSIDAEVNRVREGYYSIGSWADDHHHESYAVETAIYEPGADELHEGFTYEELLNMQRRDETDQHRSETAWGRTQYSHPIDRARRPSIDTNPSTSIDLAHTTSIDIRSKLKTTVSEKDKFDNEYLTLDEFSIFMDPDGHARAIDGRILNVSRKDIADILQTANGAENLFVHQRNIPEYQQKDTKEFYDAAGGIDKSFKLRSRHPTRPSIDVDVPTSVDVDVPTSVDRRPEFSRRPLIPTHSYICLPEHASSFTQTKLVPEIYTKDEINEMFNGIYGEQEKNKEDFQMKLDGVYYPLNDSISWLTTCMEEMRQDIARIQRANDVSRSTSIDRHRSIVAYTH
ncbi:hypothetical protein F2Q70_00029807 [Brassica cretica]|uniref:Uncharacterized protein n=1 Tax=Brassica cretica TaxID=69181 RepID=A0A8S9FE22_BRACR|nr:hypothetical protein F2Q70_00029807 [Brassica cretica]